MAASAGGAAGAQREAAAMPRFDCDVLEGAAGAGYAVQGMVPPRVLLPASEEEAAGALAACNAAGLAVVPWGGGTLQALGYPPERLDAVLSLERVNRIVSYEPADLTVSVQAGCTAQALLDALAPHGQMLPFDLASPGRATLGGAIAANLAGPRRFGPGSFRDLLIGLTVAAPDGTISHSGGMVVKNVSGYDMMKLHLGALGTLGLLLRLNFKVLTRPAADSTALIAGPRPALPALAAALAGSALALDSLELAGPGAPASGDDGWRLAARLTGSERGLARKRAELLALCAGQGLTVDWLDGAAAAAWWQGCTAFLAPGEVGEGEALLRLAALPAELGAVLDDVERQSEAVGLPARLLAHAGNGVLFARLVGPDLPRALPGLWSALCARWPNAALLAAPPALKTDLEVWGPLPSGFALMQRIKAQFDPRRTLNPGRYVGRL